MRRFLLAFVIMLSGVLWGQNAIVGTGFSNGWGSNGTTNNYEYLSSSSGTSYIKTDVANGTGNQYFRFGIEWGGTVKQVTITEGSDVSVSPETEYQLTMGTGGTNSGSMYLNVSSTSHNYVFKTEQAGSSPSGKFIIFLVQGTVRSVTSVTAPTAYINQDLTVTANLDGSLSAGQGVYLRYTSNDFVNSSVLEMMGSGTTYTANIPAGTNTSGATIKYYVFTSGDGLTIDPSKADWYTININNNSGNNYSYIPSAYQTTASATNWSSTASWNSGTVPASGAPVTIAHSLTLDQNATVSSLTINNSVTLTSEASAARVLTIASGGTFTNNGTFTANDGTVEFAGPGTVSGSVTFNNVMINGAMAFSSSNQTTINGTLTVKAGGYVTGSTNTPVYGPSSTLRYETGGDYEINNLTYAWTNGASVGQGVPMNLEITTTSPLRLKETRTVPGNVTIGASGTLTLESSGLNIGGNLVVNGTLNTGTQTVTMNGSVAQEISGSTSSLSIYNLTLNNSTGAALSRALTVSNSLTLSAGDLDLNGNTITLGSSATLSETAGNTVKGTTGVIQTTRDLNNPSSLNVAGLGATITSLANLGSTTIQRGHAARTGNGKTSILRYYDISPTTNTGLDATLVFNYDDSELNSKPEANLVLFRSTDGTNWTYRGGSVNSGANTITLSGIDAFSIWTAGDSDNPLPVELTSFTARMTGTNVKLNWATASEIDNFGFEIERTLVTEGQDNTFSKIGFVEGNGTVYTPKEYTWVDNTVNKPGKYQYRLKQIDTDGDFEYSDAVEVVFEAPKSFELSQNYPNPFNPSTRISFTVPADSRVKISVFNGVGELIKVLEDGIREAGYHSVVFDAASLPSGMYYYRLEAGDFVQSRKMLLIK